MRRGGQPGNRNRRGESGERRRCPTCGGSRYRLEESGEWYVLFCLGCGRVDPVLPPVVPAPWLEEK